MSTDTEPQRHTRHGSLRIQTVPTLFTLWTDRFATQLAKPSQYNDFHTVEPDPQDGDNDENAREDDEHR
jgi:hypothetical protein